MHAKLGGVGLRGLLSSIQYGQYGLFCSAAASRDVYDVAIVGAGLTGAALAAGLGDCSVSRQTYCSITQLVTSSLCATSQGHANSRED